MASGKSNGNRSRNHSHDNMGCASVGEALDCISLVAARVAVVVVVVVIVAVVMAASGNGGGRCSGSDSDSRDGNGDDNLFVQPPWLEVHIAFWIL